MRYFGDGPLEEFVLLAFGCQEGEPYRANIPARLRSGQSNLCPRQSNCCQTLILNRLHYQRGPGSGTGNQMVRSQYSLIAVSLQDGA